MAKVLMKSSDPPVRQMREVVSFSDAMSDPRELPTRTLYNLIRNKAVSIDPYFLDAEWDELERRLFPNAP